MLFTLVAVLFAVSCAWASARRLKFAAEVTALDPEALLGGVRRSGWDALEKEIADEPAAAWERELASALRATGSARIALVNEQLGELDYQAQTWARVPRVCASISSSSGFLLASLAVRAGLAAESADGTTVVLSALNAAAAGLAGAVFCIAVHARAGAMTKRRLAATDKLVARLEALREEGERPSESSGGVEHPRA
ncbi:MAG TPA: hypothetical protein VGI39_35830 [Polyangiaceae bacterium]